jgi:N-acetyl-anhydromuramyl-L-alanine amidase AmpD
MSPDDVEYLVVHTAAFPHRNCDRDLIDRWHRDRGWSGIGYHYVIINDLHDDLADGTVQEGRSISTPGAHVLGLNRRSVGICCVGHGDRQPHTEAQRESLLHLLSDLLDRFPRTTVDGVIGHREVNRLVREGVLDAAYRTSKTCPGTQVDMDEVRAQLRELRAAVPGDGPTGRKPSRAKIREALETLRRVRPETFPNAGDELRAFLFHPEVRAFDEEE